MPRIQDSLHTALPCLPVFWCLLSTVFAQLPANGMDYCHRSYWAEEKNNPLVTEALGCLQMEGRQQPVNTMPGTLVLPSSASRLCRYCEQSLGLCLSRM